MRRNRSFKGLIFAVIIIIIVLFSVIVLNSTMFEKNPPIINLEDKIYWNKKLPIPINIEDDSGIKSIKVSLDDGKKEQVIELQRFNGSQKSLNFNLKFPQNIAFNQDRTYKVKIEVSDISKWNFFMGNTSKKVAKLIIDTKKPDIYIINQSYKIAKGGSATVVFYANDENLKDVYITTKFGKNFKATPFYKNGYYAALLAWPINENSFSANVVAIDLADNKSTSRVRYFLQDRKYKQSTITLNDKFLDGKISYLANKYAKNPDSMSKLDKFKFINETLRISNENKIHAISSNVPEKSIADFYIKPFYPLKNGAAVASFADHRFYTYNNKDVSQSWHLGLDLASTAQANIIATNPSVVVFDQDNGIYGLNLILYHGFGLYTLYGHCSSSDTTVGQQIKPGSIIAKTGSSGLALGDHLHFGVLVQGVEVRPEEWMDKKWMKENIFDVLELSKKVIDKK